MASFVEMVERDRGLHAVVDLDAGLQMSSLIMASTP
jgi:hypothetical protein